MAPQQLSTSSQLMEVDRKVSIAEAARLARKHEATVRRWCKKGALPGAQQKGTADPWVIPVSALVAVNWCSDVDLDQLDERLNPDFQHLAKLIVDLEAQLVAEQARREAAEQRLVQSEVEVGRVWNLLERLVPETPNAVNSERRG